MAWWSERTECTFKKPLGSFVLTSGPCRTATHRALCNVTLTLLITRVARTHTHTHTYTHSHAEPLNYSLAVLGPSVMKRSDSQESVWLTHTNTHTHKGLEDPQYSDPSRALAFIRGQMVALKQEVIDIMTWPSQQAVCDVFLRHTGRQISCTSTVCRPCLCHSV